MAARAFASKDVEMMCSSPTVRKNGGYLRMDFIYFCPCKFMKFHDSGFVCLVVVFLHEHRYCILTAGSDDCIDSMFVSRCRPFYFNEVAGRGTFPR